VTATPDTGFVLVDWAGTGLGSYNGSSLTAHVTMQGPVSELATYAVYIPPTAPTYTLTLDPVGLPSSVVWSASIGSDAVTGTGALVFTGLANQTYTVDVATVSPSAGVEYVPAQATFPVQVAGTTVENEPTFSAMYEVTVAGSTGGTVTPGSSWQGPSATLSLSAVASAGYHFVNWTGTGTGSYTGTSPSETITVTGPVTEFATFAANATKTTTVSGSSGSDTDAIVALVALLIVGLVVGLVIARAGGRRPPPAAVAPAAETTAPSGAEVYTEGPEDSSTDAGETVYGGSPP